MKLRTFLAVLAGIVLGAGGASAAFLLTDDGTSGTSPTPAVYTNANGGDALDHPDDHLGAAVRFHGTVLASDAVHGGSLVVVEVAGRRIAAHVWDPAWIAPATGAAIEIVGSIRGRLGEARAAGLPAIAPLASDATVVDVSAAVVPSRRRASASRSSTATTATHPRTTTSKAATTTSAPTPTTPKRSG